MAVHEEDMRWLALTPIFVSLGSTTAVAQSTVTYDRVLLPLATGEVPGAFGSRWWAEAVVHNADTVSRDFDADQYCISECPPRAIPPGQTGHVLFRGEPADNPGQIVFVEQPSNLVAFESRVQDLSRQAQTWGTEIPVVRENQFVTRPVELLNVPVDQRFRLMLRIYDIDGRNNGAVRVSVYPFPGRGASIGDIDLQLQPPTGRHPKYKPAYAQFSDVRNLIPSGFNAGSVIGVRVTPLTPDLRIWAFVSVTNNETQHVTTITPQ